MIDFTTESIFKLRRTENEYAREVEPLLIQGEEILGCYKTVRDFVVFTSKRVIAVNIQGVTGKKKDFSTLPYSKVQAFSIETSGTFDMDSELQLFFSGLGRVSFEFLGSSDIVRIGQIISTYIL